jgi:quercetin dioxygenase-like cupin family protein
MKKVILLIACVLLLTSVAYAGDLYTVTEKGGVAGAAKAPFPMDKIDNGCTLGVSSTPWGITGYVFSCPKGAAWPLHTGPDRWWGYVAIGTVESTLGTADKANETHTLSAGDVITFEPNTNHGWLVTSDVLEFFFIQVPANLKVVE